MAQIKIKQIKSRINCPKVQKRTLDALGLRKMNHTVVKEDNPSIRGMVQAVHHLFEVTEASQRPKPTHPAADPAHGAPAKDTGNKSITIEDYLILYKHGFK